MVGYTNYSREAFLSGGLREKILARVGLSDGLVTVKEFGVWCPFDTCEFPYFEIFVDGERVFPVEETDTTYAHEVDNGGSVDDFLQGDARGLQYLNEWLGQKYFEIAKTRLDVG